jgi:glycosyltransferase involved in cell wall biosynthesis
MENESKISVAMATYNGHKYIKAQLDSIFSQTLLPDEIIVCDDCSTDNTVDILKEYKNKSRLKYFVNDHNLGFVKNFEKAISLCKNKYIVISDQDDIWFEDKIERLFNKIKELENQNFQSPILVHSDATLVDSQLNIIKKAFIGKKAGKKKGLNNLLFGNNKVQGASSLFNSKFKDLFLPIPDEVELYDYYASLIIETFGISYFIPIPLMYYRQHTTNAIGSNKVSLKERYYRFIKLDFRISTSEERNSVNGFYNQFSQMFDKKTRFILFDYFFILDSDNKIITKFCKIIRNKFNSNGLIIKLLFKVFVKHFKLKVL